MLDAIVTKQAAMIAYINDYWILMVLTLATIPLIFIIGNSRQKPIKTNLEDAVVVD
jgi:DHA2 family multidrug resistance protein